MTDVELGGNAWNDLLDGLGSTHNVGEALDIVDDIGDNLCPNPSTGTVNQGLRAECRWRCGYELVDAQSSTIYQGTWQTGTSYAAGEIVERSGIDYISLHNSNTDTPTPAVESWSGFVEGFFYRGTAPVTATNYNYGHIVLNPTDGCLLHFPFNGLGIRYPC